MSLAMWLFWTGVVVLVAAGVWLFVSRRRTQRLERRFGPEYARALEEQGDRRSAEKVLTMRERRVEQLEIRTLTPDERSRFEEAWRNDQARFVDDPAGAVKEADRLIGELMSTRGYPVSDFEQRAADISVHYPLVVKNYRAAHAIAVRHEQGQASTEDLRNAMVHYRALFDELLGTAWEPRRARAG